MKFSKIAAAAVLAASTVPAMAMIGTNKQEIAELFLVVSDANASYVLDTGIKFDTFVSSIANKAGTTTLATVGDANWLQYLTKDANLNDGTVTAGTRWQLAAVFTDGAYGVEPVSFVTTKHASATKLWDANAYFSMANNVQDRIGNVNSLGTHVDPDAENQLDVNGSSLSLPSDNNGLEYYSFMNFGALNYAVGNKVGDVSKLFWEQTATTNGVDKIKSVPFAGDVSFDGTNLTYTVAAVPAIPEPETYALMLAGLVAVAGIARRRRAA